MLYAGIATRLPRYSALSFRAVCELLAAALAAWFVVMVVCNWTVMSDLRTAASSFASLAGTMLGFVVTALSILMSLGGSVLIQKMKETGHLNALLHDLLVTSAYFGVALLAAIPPIFAWRAELVFPLAGSVGFFIAGLARMTRAGHRFYLVLAFVR